jgi:hypothetical protein
VVGARVDGEIQIVERLLMCRPAAR